MKKKLFAIITVLVVATTAIGCGNGDKATNKDDQVSNVKIVMP